jgi:hypothetical protein
LISRQEYEAWGALLACQGQLRLAPSGHMTGIDMVAALNLGAARGCDLAVLSELLPAAETGLVEALSSARVREDGAVIKPRTRTAPSLALVSNNEDCDGPLCRVRSASPRTQIEFGRPSARGIRGGVVTKNAWRLAFGGVSLIS